MFELMQENNIITVPLGVHLWPDLLGSGSGCLSGSGTGCSSLPLGLPPFGLPPLLPHFDFFLSGKSNINS